MLTLLEIRRRKMAQETNQHEIDKNNPEYIKKLIFALYLVSIFMIATGCFLFNMERFVCERSKGVCEFQERRLWNTSYVVKKQIFLSDITNVYVDTHYGKDTTYQVVLKTTNGEYPLFHFYSSGYETHSDWAKKINYYLNSQDENLEIKDSFWLLLFALVLIMIGCFDGIYIPHILRKRLKKLESVRPILPSPTTRI